MPQARYLRRDRSLHVAKRLIDVLQTKDAVSGRRFLELARGAGPRICKLAAKPRSLARWQRELNEPAHFSPRFRVVDRADLRAFVRFARSILDEKDKYAIVAIVAAINEIFSNGRFCAVLGEDAQQRLAAAARDQQRCGVSSRLVTSADVCNGVTLFCRGRQIPPRALAQARGSLAGRQPPGNHGDHHLLAIERVEAAYMIAVKRTSLLFGILYGALLFGERRWPRTCSPAPWW
jgi:hypothetical protein